MHYGEIDSEKLNFLFSRHGKFKKTPGNVDGTHEKSGEGFVKKIRQL